MPEPPPDQVDRLSRALVQVPHVQACRIDRGPQQIPLPAAVCARSDVATRRIIDTPSRRLFGRDRTFSGLVECWSAGLLAQGIRPPSASHAASAFEVGNARAGGVSGVV